MRDVLAVALPVAILFAAALARGDESRPEEPRPISLDEAVKLSLARNPTAKQVEADVRKAEALVEQARASSLPTVAANATYTRLDSDREFGGRVIASANQLSANVVLSVPIVAPRAWMQWSHASDAAEVARLGAVDARRQLAVGVARAYLAVVAQKRVIVATEHALAAAKAHADFAAQRLVGGVGNRIDDIRAKQELATNQSRLYAAQAGLVKTREALGVLVGEEKPVDVTDGVSLQDPPPLASALHESAKRSDVRTAQMRVRAAEATVRHGWADYMPSLSAVGQPFYQEPPTLTFPQTGWQAQILFTLPLFDGGARYGAKHERDANASAARAQLDGAMKVARAEVRSAYEAVRRADEALSAGREAAKLANEAMELATTAYRAGATTNLELIDATRRVHDAETAAVVAEDAARQARLDLLAACGRFP
jgi:outer membrane protein TolC